MSAARPAAAPAGGQQEEGGSSMWRMIMNAALVYFASQAVMGFLGFNKPPTPPAPADGAPPSPTANASIIPAKPLWPLGTELDLHMQLSTDPEDFYLHTGVDAGLPSWDWQVKWGEWKWEREWEGTIRIPQSVQHNASLYLDIYVLPTEAHASPDPSSAAYDKEKVYHFRKMLTRYYPKRKVRKEHNLLHADEEKEEPEQEEEVDPKSQIIVPYWHPNLTLALISETPDVQPRGLPPALAPYVNLAPWTLDPEKNVRSLFYPIVYPNDFWLLKEHMTEVNSTTPELPLKITLNPMGWMKFQIYASVGFGFDQQSKTAGSGGAEIEEIKRMLIETNPILLITTVIVSLLHTLFEFLAFKSDISHWRKKDELTGVSVRTIVTNCVVQLIILLYLVDNSVETSWMILGSQGIGLLIEAWKITKAVDITLVPSPAGKLLPYQLQITDKHVLSEDERKTQEYDALAFRYVSYFAVPLLVGYAAYSLMYESHRGWYSFVITTLTSFVYMFGFVQLIPQLIINYKLKSVAHMPMKAMIYKTLGTVVDDFFAFCIKMPWLHRLACFRDDVVFLVFLYQRWIYRVDPKRANEYGQLTVEGVQDDKKELTEDVKLLRAAEKKEKEEEVEREGEMQEPKKTR
ncbi:cleft lip and palate transmembrane 1 [Dacryopinax primogenitus]|uniref:Cleft lip and palate transmembrane 1 n=1 Tax=Dacryopinax primogenitus (strain DJM 731) TaxID=1858805 RepID=M5FRC8_DACPD|nr:cleft lip and palate transmembrane 1 [Dacryopinax primogenitus]EJT97514.1 cleft lip and palate transmembrane 1 [Dacryopinax primogenitus]